MKVPAAVRRALAGHLLFVLAIAVMGCGTSAVSESHPPAAAAPTLRADSVRHPAPKEPETFAPNTVRIIGTIVTIDSTNHPEALDQPCGSIPCIALVRVDSILGYGMAFPTPLHKGSEIAIQFAYTLAPTAQTMPRVKPSYPGLAQGSRFLADVEGLPGIRTPKRIQYTVYGYEVR